jgi:cell division protein FtsI (penicillin-binding protein 3)
MVPLSLVRSMRRMPQVVISAETAPRASSGTAVQPGSTAPSTDRSYRVGGKTGTAHKQENGTYAAHKYVSSFVGFAPVSSPRLVIAVMIDEPSNGQYYGGAVAAPVFARVMEGALRLTGVLPDAPRKPIELPAEGHEVKESI